MRECAYVCAVWSLLGSFDNPQSRVDLSLMMRCFTPKRKDSRTLLLLNIELINRLTTVIRAVTIPANNN